MSAEAYSKRCDALCSKCAHFPPRKGVDRKRCNLRRGIFSELRCVSNPRGLYADATGKQVRRRT